MWFVFACAKTYIFSACRSHVSESSKRTFRILSNGRYETLKTDVSSSKPSISAKNGGKRYKQQPSSGAYVTACFTLFPRFE